jgi:hypothetical protein
MENYYETTDENTTFIWKDPTDPSAIGQDVWSKNLQDLRKMREIRENNNLKLTQ